MNLRQIASKFETTNFDTFDEATQTWNLQAMPGKVFPVDRFLSIFHRATRRRALGIAPKTALPASFTIREPNTGSIYMVGGMRGDSMDGVYYDRLGILHESFHLGTITRKAPVGPANDPGVLVQSTVSSHYMDIELRSSAETDEATENFESHFFLTCPASADLQQWDYVSYSGQTYHVQSVYNDSGFSSARVVQRVDPRVDVVYHRRGSSSGYDPATGVVTDGLVNYNVSGFFRGFKLESVDNQVVYSGDVQFIIKVEHIGFEPASNDELTYGTKKYKIHSVEKDFLGSQYKLHCRV